MSGAMNPKRRVDICGSYGDEAGIAAHGLCCPCDRRVKRQVACANDGWNPGDTRKQRIRRAARYIAERRRQAYGD